MKLLVRTLDPQTETEYYSQWQKTRIDPDIEVNSVVAET
jgi:hypothetical protein